MKFKALPGRVIARIHINKHQEQKTESGIVLPENEKNAKDITHWVATVLDTGFDQVKVGDEIVFGKWAGSTLINDLVSVVGTDILGINNDEK